MLLRFEVQTLPTQIDPTVTRILGDFKREHPKSDLSELISHLEYRRVFWLECKDTTVTHSQIELWLCEILVDTVLEKRGTIEVTPKSIHWERRFRAGMTDNRARTLSEAITLVAGKELTDLKILSGDLWSLTPGSKFTAQTQTQWEKFIFNPYIHRLTSLNDNEIQNRFEANKVSEYFKTESTLQNYKPTTYEILNKPVSTLNRDSKDGLWALSETEMLAIQNFYQTQGRNPLLGEMEVLAQTWSEHCKHKIFAAEIEYSSNDKNDNTEIPTLVDGLFKKTIRGTTQELPKPWLLSVFSDNAGIVATSDTDAVCIKVETHNSPSALDPFGGAITGIGGVHRDVMGCGLGAKPIFNTNVFCTAPSQFDDNTPDRILPPSRVLEGIRHGVESGGNQSGIPTVNGALVYDESYIGKPLVFCGSGGWMPRTIAGRKCEEKMIHSGDYVVMAGGRVGRDGIHGATFSSLALTQDIPGSVVQLGDPITQKRLLDFLLEARDLGLYRCVTDNGAGGLSSSVGELSQITGGADIDLTHVLLKATNLTPEEILISESQERMTFAVQPETWEKFSALALRRNVEITKLGVFNESGYFKVTYQNQVVANLDLKFLHEGCPRLKLKAIHEATPLSELPSSKDTITLEKAWTTLLSSPNIRAKTSVIRQYDHEVQGCSVIKPETQIGTHRSPNQAAVFLPRPDADHACSVSCGILPEYGKFDAYTMGMITVDEAVRNLLSHGSEFSLSDDTVLALVDNFCWPDPTQNTKFCADLVRTAYGMRKAAVELKTPFISGKDSMKNDYRGAWNGKPVTISVTPTLLITALGRLPQIERARTSEFKQANDEVFILGPHEMEFLGSQFEKLNLGHTEERKLPQPNWKVAQKLYSWLGSKDSMVLKSCADVSEGGLLVALAECCFARGLGFKALITPLLLNELKSQKFFFGEGFHTFVVSVSPENKDKVMSEWYRLGLPYQHLGSVQKDAVIRLGEHTVSVAELEKSWSTV